MRSNSSSAHLQNYFRTQFNIPVDSNQYEGIYYGRVVQTDDTVAGQNPAPISRGNMTLVVPTLNPTTVWGPVPYPSDVSPPVGTICSVLFDKNATPYVIGFYGWTPHRTLYGSSNPPSSSTGHIGDYYIYTGTTGIKSMIFGPKTHSGWGSGTTIN
jgi:hypothetical protein